MNDLQLFRNLENGILPFTYNRRLASLNPSSSNGTNNLKRDEPKVKSLDKDRDVSTASPLSPLKRKHYLISEGKKSIQSPFFQGCRVSSREKCEQESELYKIKSRDITNIESNKSICYIQQIPRDVLQVIFEWVGLNTYSLKELQDTAIVCKQWNEVIWNLVRELSVNTSSSSIKWDCFLKMKRLTVLDINWHIEDGLVWEENLTQLKSLKKLLIYHKSDDYDSNNTHHQYHPFYKNLPNLEILSLVYYRRTIPFEPSLLTGMDHLKQLCIGNSLYLNDQSIKRVAQLISLESLSVFSAAIGDEGARCLTSLVNLRILDISCNHSVSDKGVEDYTKLTKLTHLDIGGTMVSQTQVNRLKQNIVGLNIGHLPGDPLKRESKKTILHQSQ